MAVAKVILNGTTLIDVTQKTVTPENMLNGITALKNDGTDISGTIQSKSSSDIIVDGALVQIPAGYYTASTSKSITAGSATTPATTITANPSISVGNNGLITVSVSSNQSITPTVSSGYITTGTPGTVTVSGSSNSQLSVQAAATITPTESSQVAVASGKYTTGVVTVGAVSSNYIGSNIPQKTSTDLSASGSAVIVPSGYYAATVSKNISAGALHSSLDVTFAPNFSIQTGGIVRVAQNIGGKKMPIQTAGYFYKTDGLQVSCAGVSTYQLDTQAATTITPTESEQTAVAAGKYTTGIVKVGAISSTYIGSGVTQNDSSDLIVSNAVVTVPSGYYAAAASTLVPDSFTISDVSNTTGITAEISAGNGGGNYQIKTNINPTTSSQIITPDVGYDALSSVQINAMPVGTVGTPTVTKGSVSNHSISITPSVTNSTGYITGGIITGTAITVSANELVSGSQSISENGTYNVINLASVVVDVSSGSGLTSHGIYLEFNDSTSTNIEIDYDDSLISAMITNYDPATWMYNNKQVIEAQLDGVTFYEATIIPLNTQLVDFTTCTYGYAVGENANVFEQEWSYVTDYIAIDPTMTFSYKAYYWFYIGFYDGAHNPLNAIYVYNDGTQDPNYSNTGYGTLSGVKIPQSARYVRLCGEGAEDSRISLIRTA